VKKDTLLFRAHELQESGKIDEAETLFKKILRYDPQNFVVLYSLGVIRFKKNDICAALSCFIKAKQTNPSFAPLFYNIGLACCKLGKHDEAISHLKQALELDSNYETARKQLELITGQIVTVDDYYHDLVNAIELQSQSHFDEAAKIFMGIVAKNEQHAASLYSLGVLEHQRGKSDSALAYFERCLVVQQEYAPLWNNRGIVLHALKRHEESVASYEKALQIDPHYVEAMINLGAVLAEMKRQKDALVIYEELLKIDPHNSVALCNRGILLSEFKLYDLAVQTFSALLRIAPEYDYAPGLHAFAKLNACMWEGLADCSEEVLSRVRAGKRACKTQGILALSDDPMDHLICAKTYADHHHLAKEPLWCGERYNHTKIRIAYISPDFREHPVGHLTAGIFEQHDKEKFEITAISLGIDDKSHLRQRMLDAFDRFIDVRQMSNRDVALMLRDMEIDIAVDLAGFTADSRTDIFSWRPAPVQVNYLGYSSTMGADYYDYIIADRHIIPEATRNCYSEKTVYLPDTYLPTDATVQIAATTSTRKEHGLPAEGFIFCSFNHDYKINPSVFDVWMRLLRQVPGSVLWLMKLNELAEGNLRKEAEARGVSADRIVFATRVPQVADHLARYRLADLFLDTVPYNAHTTASDVLRAGLPLVTCRGKAFAGRVAAGLLHVVDLPELITDSLEEYEQLALRLARDSGLLGSIQNKLKQNLETTALYDTARYCRNLEAAYTAIWERYQREEKPEHITVAAPIAHIERRSPEMTADEIRQKIKAHTFWYHKIELPHGIVTPGWAPLDVSFYAVPADLTGKRVLDVGAWDGFWTFEALKRGAAQVVAIDDFSDYLGKLPPESRKSWQTFDLCKEVLGYDDAQCQRYDMSLYDICSEQLGQFDIVFFFGTLYHLRHPLLALDRLSAVCRQDIYVESAILDDFSPYRGGFEQGYPGNQMVMEFYPERQYGDNDTNWWCPTLACLKSMVQAAGFGETRAWKIDSPRILSHCRGFVHGTKQSLGTTTISRVAQAGRVEAADDKTVSTVLNAVKQIKSDLVFTIFEIGALPIAGKEPFHELCNLFPGSKVIAFELEEQLCEELNNNAPAGISYYPVALGTTEEQRLLYLTEHPMCVSLYEPNVELLTKYQHLDVAMPKETTSVQTMSLDYFSSKYGICDVDFIKIDIQGAELDVFQGGIETLKNVVAIVSEVEFIPLYAKQPLFGDVSAFLIKNGFMFHKFLGFSGRMLKPVIGKNPFSGSQQMWSDAVFIRDIASVPALSDEKLLKAGVLGHLYGSPDLAYHYFQLYDLQHGTELRLVALEG
jgi:FkbM family methyltransferase